MPPNQVKAELAKINKRQDDIIRFIRNYEEKELNPMIRATNSIAVRFDGIVKALETLGSFPIGKEPREIQRRTEKAKRQI